MPNYFGYKINASVLQNSTLYSNFKDSTRNNGQRFVILVTVNECTRIEQMLHLHNEQSYSFNSIKCVVYSCMVMWLLQFKT